MYSHWFSFRCLSHQGFAAGVRMCYKLWEYCLGVILPLMQLFELVQYIKCGDDGYFTQIFSFFIAFTSLLPSTLFYLLVQVACSMLLEKCLLFKLLGQSASILRLSSMYWVKTNEGMGLSTSSGWAHRALFCTRISPLLQKHLHAIL